MYTIVHPSDVTAPLEQAMATICLALEALESDLATAGLAKETRKDYAAHCVSAIRRVEHVCYPALNGAYGMLREIYRACEDSEKNR